MSAIGPGDFVIFVGAPRGYVSPQGNKFYVVGNVYLVTEVGRRCEDAAGNVWPAIRVLGRPTISPTGRGMSAPAEAFRPFQGPEQAKRVVSEPVDGRVPA